MNFSWLESLLYGFIMGLSEILPVSSQAHRAILMKMFGEKDEGALMSLLIHLAVLLAVYMNCRTRISHMQRELRLAEVPRRRRRRQPDMQKVLDMRLMKTALVPMLLGFAAYPYVSQWRTNLGIIAAVLVVNGLILYIPQFLRSANKDSRTMSRLDSVIIGFFGALGVVPGISRVGAVNACATVRGADKSHALSWALMLSIPILACYAGLDLYHLFTADDLSLSLMLLIRTGLSSVAAYFGTFCAITASRYWSENTGFAGFAYYSWGAALFSLILYLNT